MARVEDLITEIADPRIRALVAAEVDRLKRYKRFGLVFEEHVPETVVLPGLPIKQGVRVAKRAQGPATTYSVLGISGQKVRIKPDSGPEESASRDELVVVKRFGEPMYPALRVVDEVRGSPQKPSHVLINADNYHALQLLLYGHEGKVDVIYIDPPYNTGARDWKYNNAYVDKTDQFRHSKWLAMMKKRLVLARRLLKPLDGVLVVTIDEHEVHHLGVLLEQEFPGYLRHMVTVVINPKGTGKLNFARVDEYAIFCVPNTGKSIIKGIPSAMAKATAPGEGALFVAAGSVPSVDEPDEEEDDGPDEESEEEDEADETDVDEQALPFPATEIAEWELRHARRRGSESSYRLQRPNQFYPIFIDPKSKRVVKAGPSLLPSDRKPSHSKSNGLTPVWPIDKEGNERCWRFIPEKMQSLIDAGRVVLGRFNEERQTWTLNIWERSSESKKLKTVWWKRAHDAGTHGTTLLHNLLGRRSAFPFPKSIYAVADALAAVVRTRPNALILDFFAGSGTTLHATALLNSLDGGQRRCIMVTNNEVSEKTYKKLAAKGVLPGSEEFEAHGICESATWPRTRAVLTGKRAGGSTPLTGNYLSGRPLAAGFEENVVYFRLDFLDPTEIARGERFEAVAPLLWLLSGAKGQLTNGKATGKWYFPKHSPFAVLIKEDYFRGFREELSKRGDVTHVFLVTDSVEAFNDMSDAIGAPYERIQLYKTYLDTFRVNLEDPHAL